MHETTRCIHQFFGLVSLARSSHERNDRVDGGCDAPRKWTRFLRGQYSIASRTMYDAPLKLLAKSPKDDL